MSKTAQRAEAVLPSSVARRTEEATGDYVGRKANRYRLAALKQFAGKRVLDVGCGNGAYVFALQDSHDMHGLDMQSFPQWEQSPDRFRVGSATDLPFEDESFDTLCSFETLEHLDDPAGCLRELRRVTRKRIIISVPNCEISRGMRESNLLYSHWSDPTHCQFFSKTDIEALVEANGFRLVESRYINPIKPWPFILELLGFKGGLYRFATKALKRLPQKRYFITTLVVADKEGSGS